MTSTSEDRRGLNDIPYQMVGNPGPHRGAGFSLYISEERLPLLLIAEVSEGYRANDIPLGQFLFPKRQAGIKRTFCASTAIASTVMKTPER